MNMGEQFMGRKSKLTQSKLAHSKLNDVPEWGVNSEQYGQNKRFSFPSSYSPSNFS